MKILLNELVGGYKYFKNVETEWKSVNLRNFKNFGKILEIFWENFGKFKIFLENFKNSVIFNKNFKQKIKKY